MVGNEKMIWGMPMLSIPDKITFISDMLNFIFVFAVFYFTAKYRKKFLEKYLDFKSFYILVLLNLIVALFGNLIDVIDEFEVNGHYLKSSLTTQLTSWIFAVTIGLIGLSWIILLRNLSEKYLSIPIKTETSFRGIETDKIHPGLYLTTKKDSAYSIFRKLLSNRAGLVISRTPPDEIRELLKLERTPIVWITKISGKYRVNPKNLDYLINGVLNFLKSDELKKVVLIEGTEYLITENDFKKVLDALTLLKDYAIVNDAVITAPIKTTAYNEKELSILFEEFKILE